MANAEQNRFKKRMRKQPWYRWGPYLSEGNGELSVEDYLTEP